MLFTSAGLLHGSLRYDSKEQGEAVIADQRLEDAFPPRTVEGGDDDATRGRSRQVSETPICAAMTQYHFLLLYPDSLVAMSRISGQVMWEQSVEVQHGGDDPELSTHLPLAAACCYSPSINHCKALLLTQLPQAMTSGSSQSPTSST